MVEIYPPRLVCPRCTSAAIASDQVAELWRFKSTLRLTSVRSILTNNRVRKRAPITCLYQQRWILLAHSRPGFQIQYSVCSLTAGEIRLSDISKLQKSGLDWLIHLQTVWLFREQQQKPTVTSTIPTVVLLRAAVNECVYCIEFAHWHWHYSAARKRKVQFEITCIQMLEGARGKAGLEILLFVFLFYVFRLIHR